MSVGVADSTDLVFSVPLCYFRVLENDQKVVNRVGLGDILVEAKWRALTYDSFSFAVKPSVFLPTGDDALGFGTGKPGFGISLIGSQDLGALQLHTEATYLHTPYAQDETAETTRSDNWEFSVAAAYEAAPGFQVVGELGMAKNLNKASRTWPAFISGGVIYTVTEGLDLDLGVRGALNRVETDYAILAGVTTSF